MKPYSTPKIAVLHGMRDFLPFVMGAMPWGVIYGATSAKIGFDLAQTAGMSILVLAGAAQLTAVELIRANAAAWVVIFSAAVVNLRFMVYSASLAPHLRGLPTRWKLLLGYFITDEPYALAISYYTEFPDAPHKKWYFLGIGMILWVTWITSSVAGNLLGAIVPESLSLDLTTPLMFLGLLVSAIKDYKYVVAALVSACIALLATGLPHNLGLVVAIAGGLMAGYLLERKAS